MITLESVVLLSRIYVVMRRSSFVTCAWTGSGKFVAWKGRKKNKKGNVRDKKGDVIDCFGRIRDHNGTKKIRLGNNWAKIKRYIC